MDKHLALQIVRELMGKHSTVSYLEQDEDGDWAFGGTCLMSSREFEGLLPGNGTVDPTIIWL